jgi:murein DD-endopeptidase MepM/ murein hydrolase activator NlpD
MLFVTRDSDGELRKIYIPLRYIYFLLAGIVLGMLTITGIAGSYTRMAVKVAHFNQLRSEKEQLRSRYERLEMAAKEKDLQVASLGSLASEVSALYGLKAVPLGEAESRQAGEFTASLDRLYALRYTALNGAAGIAIGLGFSRSVTVDDWVRLAQAPSLWPVEGRITDPFGIRIDPFKGEGAFHRGVDISTAYGHSIIAPADGEVTYADFSSGYGRMVVLEHGYGIVTRYGHLSGFAVVAGQSVKRGDIIGYVGMSGRSTGPHLHYEVWVHGAPVNPYKYLRTSSAHLRN